jgi:nitrite reductase [NAD(P)H] small subunit
VSDWTRIGRVDEFREGRGRVVVVEGVRVAVFRVGPDLFAMRDACPHMGLSLAEAEPENGRVTCHGHGWTFDLATGRSDSRSEACAKVYDVRIEDPDVLVRPRAVDPRQADEDPWVVWDDARHARPGASDSSGSNGEERGGDRDEDADR